MAEFKITGLDRDGFMVKFDYSTDPMTLKYENGEMVSLPDVIPIPLTGDAQIDPNSKTGNFKRLRIQLGLNCNFECTYCSQQEHRNVDDSKSQLDKIEPFLEKVRKAYTGNPDGKMRIEFWGGEPLLYWKTIKKLYVGLNDIFSNATYWFPTNGSLITEKVVDEIMEMTKLNISISHDGPQQSFRGEDPLDNPKTFAAIKRLYGLKKFSFNPVVHGGNSSRKAIKEHLVRVIGDPDVMIGEGDFIDIHHESGDSLGMGNAAAYVLQSFKEMPAVQDNFLTVQNSVDAFLGHLRNNTPLSHIGSKCGMESSSVIATTLGGEILLCQNVAKNELDVNGNPYKMGDLTDLSKINAKAMTLWRERKNCRSCPVVAMCRGTCPLLVDGSAEYSSTCRTEYFEKISFIMYAIYLVTGVIVFKIEGDYLPLDRQNFLDDETTKAPAKPKPKKVWLMHPVA